MAISGQNLANWLKIYPLLSTKQYVLKVRQWPPRRPVSVFDHLLISSYS